MKKLLSILIAASMTAAAGFAFAEEDEAMAVAPNAKLNIISSAPTAPARYDQDEAMDVAPNATAVITPSPAGAPPKNEDEAMDVAPNAQK